MHDSDTVITKALIADAKAYWKQKGNPVQEYPENPVLATALLKLAVYGYLDATDPVYREAARQRAEKMAKAEKNQPAQYTTPPTPAQAFKTDFEKAYSVGGMTGFSYCLYTAQATVKHFDVLNNDTSINRLAKIYWDYKRDIALSVGYDVVKDAASRPIGNILGWYRNKCREAKQEIDNIKRDIDTQNR